MSISCSSGPVYHTAQNNASMRQTLHSARSFDYPDSPFNTYLKKAATEHRHYCTLLENGDDALLVRVHLIRQARASIYLQTFIWANDESGRFIAHELIAAAQRGVKVKILIDQLIEDRDSESIAYLSTVNPNIEIKFYNPQTKTINPSFVAKLGVFANLKKANQRMHNKILIIDDRFGITGGRNYQNDYFDRGSQRNFKDRDILVMGPAVKTMTDSFADYWNFKLSIPATEMFDVRRSIDQSDTLQWQAMDSYQPEAMFTALDELASHLPADHRLLVDETLPVAWLVFIADEPGKHPQKGLKGASTIVDDLIDLFEEAEERIILQTPYLVLDRRSRRFFKHQRRMNPELEIIVSSNSLAAADHFYAYAFSYKYKKLYLKKLKWRIFEFKLHPADIDTMVPPMAEIERTRDYFTCIHSKTFIVDDAAVFIGSFNIDPRSVHLNTEVGVIIHDKAFTRLVARKVLQDIAPRNSWTIGKRQELPGVSQFAGLIDDVMKMIPIFDAWPFGYTASFALREGAQEVPHYHDDFYKHYRSVGPFPEVALSAKELKTRLIKVFFGPFEPFI